MEDAIKVLNAKFKLSNNVLTRVCGKNKELSAWLTVLGAYILNNDKNQEEQKGSEATLRKQRLNAEHQLGQLEKQLITCNVKLSKNEKTIVELKENITNKEDAASEMEKKWKSAIDENRKVTEEIDKLKQTHGHMETEKKEFSAILDEKHKEIERLNEEWQEASKKLAEANKARYEMKYKLDEIKNSDIRKEYKEKRLEQEKKMLSQQLENANNELKLKSDLLNDLQKDKTASVLDVQEKYEELQQKHIHTESQLEIHKKKCETQGMKIENLVTKIKNIGEEHSKAEHNMQQELTAQTKLVQLYKDDRDHAKEKLEEVTSAVTELQSMVKEVGEEKIKFESLLKAEKDVKCKKIAELEEQVKQLNTELTNANDLLKVARPGTKVVSEQELASLYPLAAATSAILKKGMSLTQIYTEFVKTSDELLLEKQENERLKIYMEQILREVEEKAPLLMKQKEDYEDAKKNVESMALKLEENLKECQTLQNTCAENERKFEFSKREEKRLHTLCVDLSQQVRVLLKEVEEARGGVVTRSGKLPELLTPANEQNSSSGQVISEHLVTFKTIEELQAQNQRLLMTVRELSEEQEKLEQEGGPEIIQELKKKIELAQTELETLRDNQKTQDQMMTQLTRQRDVYKVLCEQGGVMPGIENTSTSFNGSKSMIDLEMELTKLNTELDSTNTKYNKFKDEMTTKERSLNESLTKKSDDLSELKLENGRLKDKIDHNEERYAILASTSDGYKKEANALEQKCKTVSDALTKARIEVETFKSDYQEAKEKHVTAEVNVKSLQVEKDLIKEANVRIMQENESLLNQQRSQSTLLSNLQMVQNNLERQEFETRSSLSKQVDNLQREVKALRRQQESETHRLKSAATTLENDMKDAEIKFGVEKEKNKQLQDELLNSKQQIEQLETKNKEMELMTKATEERLENVMAREASGKAKEDYQREMENYKTKVREFELTIASVTSAKKGLEEQLEVTKKNLEQFQEICNSNEAALNTITKLKNDQTKAFEKKEKKAKDEAERLKTELKGKTIEIKSLKKKAGDTEKEHKNVVSDLKNQVAPLERRFQEVTKALVQAKETETEAVKEAQAQAKIGKEAQEKYEKEIVLHGKDVEILTQLKEEVKEGAEKYRGIEEREKELREKLANSEKLLDQIKDHNNEELKKGETARQDLIEQNALLHGQVEKLSAQLATAKTHTKITEDTPAVESFSDKSVEEVYELLRFVRREKEIAETKAEASETESMRYRQRSEHLQREVDETRASLQLEQERTKGRMLTETEHKELIDKVKKVKEFEEMNKDMEKDAAEATKKYKILVEKNKKLEADLKPLAGARKSLEGEKNSWLAEKTALKQEIERWTNRTNQLMAQGTKGENEEIKKLQANKVHSEKAIAGLQDEIRRIKQQLDSLKRESLKLKTENNELQNKTVSLQNDLKNAGSKVSNEETVSKKDNDESLAKISELEKQTTDLTEKNKVIPQLKRLAKKYKTSSDNYLKKLRDNNIQIDDGVTSTPPSATAIPSTPATSNRTSIETQTPPISLSSGSGQTVTPLKPLTDDEKVKLIQCNERLEESIRNTSAVTKELDDSRVLYDTEKSRNTMLETKLDDVQKSFVESEKKVQELTKTVDALQSECNDKEKEKEKTRKLLKTVKEKMTLASKNNTTSSRENERLKKQVEELQRSLEQATRATTDQSNSFQTVRVQLDVKIINLEKQVETLLSEKRELMERLKEVQVQKKAADKFIKAASQKSSRIQAVGSANAKTASLGDPAPGYDISTITPLTATVRPSAPPTSQSPSSKFHQQMSRTASIRPLAHAAPTAMISPTVPLTQSSSSGSASNLVASVSALPPTSHVAEIQGRNVQGRQFGDRSSLSYKAPAIARVQQVQSQEREDESSGTVPSLDDDDQQPGPSNIDPTTRRVFGKRTHIDVTDDGDDDDDIALLDDGQGEMIGLKRQRVETIEDNQDDPLLVDSQEGQLEEDLLAEDVEEGDDDVIVDMPPTQYGEDMPTQGTSGSREAQLQMERQLQPSPQELLRQSRLQGRVRTQLPSFSLMSGQASSGFYEETDDSTVPSTPTLFMPKRTDGFAEAVSSPVVRFPAFSFSSSEQASSSATQSSSLELPGMHLHQETRVDLLSSEDQANVPHTPLSVVPTASSGDPTEGQTNISDGSQRDDRRVTFEQKFFPEDNGQEQNVPQQIDLTEDDDDVDDEHDLARASEEMGEMTEDAEEGIDIMANDNDLVDLEEVVDSDQDVDDDIEESDDSDDDESSDPIITHVEGSREGTPQDDAVEILVEDEDLFNEEEKEKVVRESTRHISITRNKDTSSPVFGGATGLVDEALEREDGPSGSGIVKNESLSTPAASPHEELKDDITVIDDEKPDAERTKRVRITRTAPATRSVRPPVRRAGMGTRPKSSPSKR